MDDTFIIHSDTTSSESIVDSFNKLHHNLKFTFEEEFQRTINFLDLTIKVNKSKLIYNIYRKPMSIDYTIHKTSNHPHSHKLCKFRFLIDRLINTPLSQTAYTKERKYIIQLAIDNGFNENTIQNYIRNRIRKLGNKTFTTLQPTTPKKDTTRHPMTYIGKVNNHLSSFFKKENIHITYRTNNKLNSIIPNRLCKKNKFSQSGIYQLDCTNCNKKYIGQTKRNFQIRFKEHKSDFFNNRNKSKFATHLIDSGHEINNMQKALKILKVINDPHLINTAEEFFIVKNHTPNNQLLNEQIPNLRNPLYHIIK